MDSHKGYVSYYLASKSTRLARAAYKLVILNQNPGGLDETFISSGVRLFEAKGILTLSLLLSLSLVLLKLHHSYLLGIN